MPSPVDLVIILLAIALPLLFIFRESIPGIGGRKPTLPGDDSAERKTDVAGAAGAYDGDPRDFVEKMNKLVSLQLADLPISGGVALLPARGFTVLAA